MIRNVKITPLILGLLLFAGCTYHNEEDYFADSNDTCNTNNMSFQTDIQPILQSSCVSCHNSGFASGGINLEGFENVKPLAQSGLLSKVINHANGVPAMPMNTDKLSDCTINKIDAWIEQGVKDN
jgi:cytochrome c553